MKFIKISGYFQNNVGDDLMIETLLNRYPDVVFWGYKENQKKSRRMMYANYISIDDIYKKYGGINNVFNQITRGHMRDALIHLIIKYIERHCCCAVGIGGSLYGEWDSSIEFRLQYEDSKRVNGKPYFILGANFGPYKNPCHYEAFREYFQTCDVVSFRDQTSFNLFENLPMVQWAPDIVFSINEGKISDNNTVLISVIDINENKHTELSNYSEAYFKFVGNLCKTIVERKLTPILVSFCSAEGDERAIYKIRNTVPPSINERIQTFLYDGDTDKILELFRSAHYIVATRFHAMVLALKFQKPFFAIAYDQKLIYVLKDMQLESYCDFKDVDKISMETALDQKNEMSTARIEKIEKQAERHFDALDAFLNRM